MKNIKYFNNFLNEDVSNISYNDMFKTPYYLDMDFIEQEDGKLELVDSSIKIHEFGYKIWRNEKGEYFITDNDDEIFDLDHEIDYYENARYGSDDQYGISSYDAEKRLGILLIFVGDFVEKMRSYEFQKEYLTKYPDRVNEFKPFGFNEKIKKEFEDIIEGGEFGFFNLR